MTQTGDMAWHCTVALNRTYSKLMKMKRKSYPMYTFTRFLWHIMNLL